MLSSKSQIRISARSQVAMVELNEGNQVVPSLGIELANHLILGTIQDLEARLALYQGDHRYAGETQLYFFINKIL